MTDSPSTPTKRPRGKRGHGKGRSTLPNQISRALHTITRINPTGDTTWSRHADKAAKIAHRFIYSYGSLKKTMQAVNTTLNLLPDDIRPKLLRDLTPSHIDLAVRMMREQIAAGKLAEATVKGRLSALRKFAHALNTVSWNATPPEELVPAALNVGLRRSDPRGSYSLDQVSHIRSNIATHDTRYRNEFLPMFDLIVAAGLRHEELGTLQEANLDRDTGTIRLSNTKGGKERTVHLNPIHDPSGYTALKRAIQSLPTGRHYLWTGGKAMADKLARAVSAACEELGIEGKGIHGLRATFAEQYLRRCIAEGCGENDARREVSHLLGHRRIDVTYRYVPRLS
jgi:integrase